jgi:hypothetical protein
MDKSLNPYTPNAGAQPPALTGRDDLLGSFKVLLTRVQTGMDEKGLIITGLRGVGKTVLLGKFKEIALSKSAVVVMYEIPKGGRSLGPRFGTLARRALLEISPSDRWKDRAKRAASVITSFGLTFNPDGSMRFGVDVSALPGIADSGELSADLTDVVVALGEAAKDHNQTVVFLFDEIQYLTTEELGALILAKHQVNQLRLPIVFAGAGLPQLPALAGTAQTYAERMFSFPEIGKLDEPAAEAAIEEPANKLAVEYETLATKHILSYTEGYPFFIQEYGKAVWNLAEVSPITLDDALAAEDQVEAVLDQDFFSVRTDGLPDKELDYIRALAALGSGQHTQLEVAKQMGKSSSAKVGSQVTRLIERGLIYRTRRGSIAFAVPHFDRYVLREYGAK